MQGSGALGELLAEPPLLRRPAPAPGASCAFTVLDSPQPRPRPAQAEHAVGPEMGVAATRWPRGRCWPCPVLHPPRLLVSETGHLGVPRQDLSAPRAVTELGSSHRGPPVCWLCPRARPGPASHVITFLEMMFLLKCHVTVPVPARRTHGKMSRWSAVAAECLLLLPRRRRGQDLAFGAKPWLGSPRSWAECAAIAHATRTRCAGDQTPI